MKAAIDSNVKMWCSKCQAATKGASCSWCLRGFTACAECKYCYGCLSYDGQRDEEES